MREGDRPIGVFDSGIGGLTVVKALRHLLPGEAIVYLGDTARVPYGTKSPETIIRYTLQAGAILQRYRPKLMVIACNTASSHGTAALQERANCPVLGVIEPGAQAASRALGPVGVIGTLATVASGSYERAIRQRRAEIAVHSIACPLLVSLAEEGWTEDPITVSVCRRYLAGMPLEVHTIVLGCTHYPVLLPSLTQARPNTTWIDSGEVTAQAVEGFLRGGVGYRTASARGELRLLLTDASSRLREVGSRFLGEPLEGLELVEL